MVEARISKRKHVGSEVLLTFWGVRGSIASPGAHTIVFGGNTSCVSLELGNHIVILDAGSGLRELGRHLMRREEPGPVTASLFLSHMHWDHIQGLPFFTPGRVVDNHFTIYGERKCKLSLAEILRRQMQSPYFPVSMETVFQARMKFRQVCVKHTVEVQPALLVTPFRLTHPNGALGYLVQIQGRRIAYVTDHEHPLGQVSPNVLEMVPSVDILIHDAQYSRAELVDGKVGWGHSAWEDVVELAIAARVKRLVLFHHDPNTNDERLYERQCLAQKKFPDTIVAREGLKITLN